MPTAATFNASFNTGIRQPDWRGYHTGNFTISVGTNIYAVGELYGDNGVSSHGATEPCAPCGHFEGALSGELTWLSGLPGGHIQATYAGDITGASPCSSNTPSQGPVTFTWMAWPSRRIALLRHPTVAARAVYVRVLINSISTGAQWLAIKAAVVARPVPIPTIAQSRLRAMRFALGPQPAIRPPEPPVGFSLLLR